MAVNLFKLMTKYEIQIGKAFNANDFNQQVPLKTIVITQEQFDIIKMFANQRKDQDLNTFYKLNDCEFEVGIHFDLSELNINKTS